MARPGAPAREWSFRMLGTGCSAEAKQQRRRVVVQEVHCGLIVGARLGDRDFWDLQATLCCCRCLVGRDGG